MANTSNEPVKFVSVPSRASKAGHYTCVIEQHNKPYSIVWSGSAKYPDISQLHNEPDLELEQVDLGPEMSKIWCESTFINYGADAALRCSHTGPYPVVKLAHQGEEFRSRVQREFKMIQDMTTIAQSLPIPKVDDCPLLDDQGMFGYRLEHLFRLERTELLQRLPEVRQAVRHLHEAGFSHGDLSQSNVMKNKQGAIVLIDFGYARQIGTQAPSSVPRWVYEDAVVTVEADQRALERLSEDLAPGSVIHSRLCTCVFRDS